MGFILVINKIIEAGDLETEYMCDSSLRTRKKKISLKQDFIEKFLKCYDSENSDSLV